jgi:hypothetical protein
MTLRITLTYHVFLISLLDNTHIVGPLNEITCTVDDLLAQLALVVFGVQMLKCKFWSLSGISLGIEEFFMVTPWS